MVREGESAERYLQRGPVTVTARNESALRLTVAWHGTPIGHLAHDGFEWRWSPLPGEGPTLVRQTAPGKLPPFIGSLLPKGWLEKVLKDRSERAMLRSGKRCMSNIAIVEHESDLAALPPDVLSTRLERYTVNGAFTGLYDGPGRGTIEESFERTLAQLFERADTPRLSGVQIKAPMFLDGNGRLSPSTGTPFTHILKPAGSGGFEALPLVEWTALALGRAAGFAVPASALITMPDGMAPALLVERFDIRDSDDDRRLFAMEDFCSVLDLPPQAKYDGTIERVARALRALSSSPEEDLLTLLKRALFAWLISDGDMHLKNIALLKIADSGGAAFRSGRFAPLYDAVTTRVFPRLQHDRLALTISGKDERLRRADFKTFAHTAGLRTSDADSAIDEMIERVKAAVETVALPRHSELGPTGEEIVGTMLDLCRTRVGAMQ